MVLALSPAQVQETTRPLLSSENAPAPEPRVFPPLRSEESPETRNFEAPGRNPGSAAHPMAPGRVRSDAPAWHELNHVDPPLPSWAGPLLHPRQTDPEPPVDERFHDPIRLSGDFRNDDYPFILSDPDDRDDVWMLWTSYSGRRDRLHLARRDPGTGTWGPWNPVPGVNGDAWRPSMAFDSHKRLWVVWAQPERLFEDEPNFDLYARWFDGEHWGRLERLTSAPGSDFNHRLARDGDGSLHLVWQGIRQGQADILDMSYDGESWSPERRVSESPRNDWTPALALDSKGAVWIAYEVGEAGWGKDQGLLVDRERQPGSMLNRERTVAVRILDGQEITVAVPWSVGRLSMSASATPSAEGGLWLGWPRDNFPTFTHRHTELSLDLRGVPDGSVLDFYRYMIDVAAMDFGLISDHQYGAEREYWWWLEEKLADHVPLPAALYRDVRVRALDQLSPWGIATSSTPSEATCPVPFYEQDQLLRHRVPEHPLPQRRRNRSGRRHEDALRGGPALGRHHHPPHQRHDHGHELARQRPRDRARFE